MYKLTTQHNTEMLRKHRTPQEAEIFPTTVSASTDGWWWARTSASNTLNADDDKIWNAGKYAPASIRFDFDAPVRCTRISLLPCMSPESGHVRHEIRVGTDVYKFSGRATDRQWIHADINADGQRVKFIQINTLTSPSWVAWRRVRFWTQLPCSSTHKCSNSEING